MWFGTESDHLARIDQRLAHIERLLERMNMARHETDAAIIAEVHRNTDVVTAAIAEWSAELADVTKKLEDAIANSDASDDADVLAAVAELKGSNDRLAAKVPVPAPVV